MLRSRDFYHFKTFIYYVVSFTSLPLGILYFCYSQTNDNTSEKPINNHNPHTHDKHTFFKKSIWSVAPKQNGTNKFIFYKNGPSTKEILEEIENKIEKNETDFSHYQKSSTWKNAPIISTAEVRKAVDLRKRIIEKNQCLFYFFGINKVLINVYGFNTNPIYSYEWENFIKSLPTSLKKLQIEYTNYTGEGLEVMRKFTALTQIQLGGLNFPSTNWEILMQNLPPTLKKLAIMYSSYQGENIDSLNCCNNLNTFYLSGAKFSRQTWTQLFESLTHRLEKLYLINTNYQAESMNYFKKFFYLDHLSLKGSQWKRANWHEFIKVIPSSINTLDLSSTNFIEIHNPKLTKIPHLILPEQDSTNDDELETSSSSSNKRYSCCTIS